MSTRIALRHTTRYAYDRPVGLAPHEVRLHPAPHGRTPIESYALAVRPAGHSLRWHQDAWGNRVARLAFPDRTRSLEITVDLVATLARLNPFDFVVDFHAAGYPFAYGPEDALALGPCLEREPLTPRLAALLEEARALARPAPVDTTDFLVRANRLVRDRVDYLVRMEPGIQAPERTLERGAGSCRDSAWLLAQLLRHLGIAARFASGYLVQLRAEPGGAEASPKPAHDGADLHAWAEAYLPGAGWMGLDATSGLATAEGHIPLACAALPEAAAPVKGTTEAAHAVLETSMTVERLPLPG